MREAAILHPVFALAAWTAVVLLLVPVARVRAGLRREIGVDDFRYGESAAVPPRVSLANRNLMNLLEVPVLFYVVALLLYVTAGATATAVALAWTYVGLRVVHSAIHLTYNRVLHRLTAFAASNVVLAALWVLAGRHVAAAG
ncbi:MAPEG family protein [Schlegelella sp. ID0723]|uniref:MAPEG family protein n=1 Tax=Piscinibacter koreensis TaxID=2742824 RepID=A0A7Y6NLG3_9BURK|nr:MAPEG family protein [Schlegelella koreensis]